MTLAIQDIEIDNYLIAIGGTTNNVYIYNFELKGNKVYALTKSAELTGHEDWVKCLQFVTEVTHKNYILASGAQDRYVRLWRLKLNDLIDDSDEDPTKLVLLSNKQYKFDLASGSRAAFSFEALIMGHDDWISGLQWHPSCKDPKSANRKLQLLTCTADTALMIWEMDSDSGIWVCVNRLGKCLSKVHLLLLVPPVDSGPVYGLLIQIQRNTMSWPVVRLGPLEFTNQTAKENHSKVLWVLLVLLKISLILNGQWKVIISLPLLWIKLPDFMPHGKE